MTRSTTSSARSFTALAPSVMALVACSTTAVATRLARASGPWLPLRFRLELRELLEPPELLLRALDPLRLEELRPELLRPDELRPEELREDDDEDDPPLFLAEEERLALLFLAEERRDDPLLLRALDPLRPDDDRLALLFLAEERLALLFLADERLRLDAAPPFFAAPLRLDAPRFALLFRAPLVLLRDFLAVAIPVFLQ